MVIKQSTSTNYHQRDCDPWISQCFLTHVFTLAILTVVMLTRVMKITVRTVSAWLAGQVLIVLTGQVYNAKDTASFYSGRWNTGTNPDLAFASVGPNSRLPDRRVLDKFPRSQHRPSLITPPRFAMAVPSMPVKRWNFRKAKWSHYIALTNKFAKTLFLPDSLNVDAAYQNFCNTIKKPKRLSHAGIVITMFCVGMQSVNSSIKLFFSLLRETTQVWLLQLCFPSLTESGGIDGPKQFVALTSHTLVEKRGVF